MFPTASTDQAVVETARDYCDPKITSSVEEAFEAVWDIIQHIDPSGGSKTDCDRKADLSQTRGSLVVEGVTDPNELRDRAIAIMTETYSGMAQTNQVTV